MEGVPGGWPGYEHKPVDATSYHEPTTVPVTEAPRTTTPPGKESKGIGKLFKRKPVAEQGMETR